MRTGWIAASLLAATLTFAQQGQETMKTNSNDNRIDYIEFPATDIAQTRAFYVQVFGWKFTDYGPDYTSFEDGRLTGGFWKAAAVSSGGALVVIYATDLAAMEAEV